MKTLFLGTLLLSISIHQFASAKGLAVGLPKSKQAIICEKLNLKALDNCARQMCEETIESDGGVATKENLAKCLKTDVGDLMEGANVCAGEGEFESVVAKYNKKNPTKTVDCSDF